MKKQTDINKLKMRAGSTKKDKSYSWKPDIPDFRDYHFQTTKGLRLPRSVDLRPLMSPVEDQGQLGSCTAQAIVGGLEYLLKKSGRKTDYVDISRLFVYYQERVIEGTVDEDSGAMIRTGIRVCNKIGACAEPLWPYQISQFTRKPNKLAYADANKRKITKYERIDDLRALKMSLASGFPVVFGFAVFDSFESQEVARTGCLNLPKETESFLGGHAVLCVGYDDSLGRIIVRNSWGTNWGMKGYFTMPYDFIANRDLCDDLWSIQKF